VIRVRVTVYYVEHRFWSDGSDGCEQCLAGFRRKVRIEYEDGMIQNNEARVADRIAVRRHDSRIYVVGEFGQFGVFFCGRMGAKTPPKGEEKTDASGFLKKILPNSKTSC
jgi:hypothetical protein